MELLIGYDRVQQLLQPILKDDSTGRFILLEGVASIGKGLIARQILQQWSSNKPIIIEPANQRSGYTIEQIREFCVAIQELGLAHARMGYVLEDMQLLSPACSHALLKTLEELPAGVIVIGLALPEPAVLPTIRSRALKVKMHPLSDEEILKLTEKNGYSYGEKSFFLRFVRGCPGRISNFFNENFQKRLPIYEAYIAASSYEQIISYVQTMDSWDETSSHGLISTQVLAELLSVMDAMNLGVNHSRHQYRQWLQDIELAQTLLQRSHGLKQVLEFLWVAMQNLNKVYA